MNRDPKQDPRKSESEARWVDAYRSETRRVEAAQSHTRRVEPRQVVPAEPHYWLNRLAPDFTLPIVDGGRLSLSDLRGYIVIINYSQLSQKLRTIKWPLHILPYTTEMSVWCACCGSRQAARHETSYSWAPIRLAASLVESWVTRS